MSVRWEIKWGIALSLLGSAVSSQAEEISTPEIPAQLTSFNLSEEWESVGCDPCLGCDSSHAYGSHTHRPDEHAPAGIMGAHVHDRGEIMLEYKYMNMYMDDNRIGTTTVSDLDAFDFNGTNVLFSPTQMTMEMHMVHAMYGLTDDITLYTMVMFTGLTMDHQRNPNRPFIPDDSFFTTHNSGFDDTSLGALWQVIDTDMDRVILNLGCSVPTGDLTRRSAAPFDFPTRPPMLPSDGELPYPMRRGSGTFDARPGVTWVREWEDASFGSQVQMDLPIGRNFDDYAVGNEYRLNNWLAVVPMDWVSFSFRVEHIWKDNYRGADGDLIPMAISTARPDMRGGYWLNFGYGINTVVLNGHRLAAELVHNVYQDLDGIQLETDWYFACSWSKAW
ncbi:Transporter [Planctomycetales bacterium 10988]|nr:Transporter [Planctomycetales bacterium 10988]